MKVAAAATGLQAICRRIAHSFVDALMLHIGQVLSVSTSLLSSLKLRLSLGVDPMTTLKSYNC